jgi:hypothetical protein
VHPQDAPPNFTAPTYAPLTAQAPARGVTLAQNVPALFQALLGGATGATGGGIAGPTPPTLPTLPAGQNYSANTLAFAQQNGPSIGAPQQTMIHAGTAPVTPKLSGGLLAALAQQGRRLGSGAGSNIIRT